MRPDVKYFNPHCWISDYTDQIMGEMFFSYKLKYWFKLAKFNWCWWMHFHKYWKQSYMSYDLKTAYIDCKKCNMSWVYDRERKEKTN